MKRILIAIVAGVLSAGVCSAAPVRIGAVYADAGPLKPLDEPSWRGAQAAAAVASREGQPVELVRIAYDSTPAGAAAGVRAALARDPSIVAFVGASDSNVALAAGREAVRTGRVFVTSGATSPLLPSQIGRRFFLACFGDNVQAAAAAEWLHRVRGARRVCVVHDTATIYTRLLRRFFEASFTDAGGVVAESVAFRGGEPPSLPTKLGEADAVFLSAETAASAAVVIRQLRAAGFLGPIVGGDGYDNPAFWAAHPDIAREVYFTTHAFPAREPGSATGSTVERFRAAYRGTPDAFGGLGFDALRLVLSGLSAGTDKLAASLQNGAPFPGVTGRIAFPRGQRVPTKPVAIVAASSPSRQIAQITPSRVPQR